MSDDQAERGKVHMKTKTCPNPHCDKAGSNSMCPSCDGSGYVKVATFPISDDSAERGLRERVQEMDADVGTLETVLLGFPHGGVALRRLRENVNVLLGEGDAWSQDAMIPDPRPPLHRSKWLVKKPKPICWLCKKPIKGVVRYQAGHTDFPSHRKCLVVIKKSKDGGI